MVFQILTALVLILGLIVWSACEKDGNTQKDTNQTIVTSSQIRGMSREDIQKALKKIETKTPPAMKMGAMCYIIEYTDKQSAYFCPNDAEKTVYAEKAKAYWIVQDITEMRRLVKEFHSLINAISVSLDEKKLCSKCFPDIPDEERGVSLVIKFADGRVVRTDGVDTNDLRYLIGFFTDGLNYKTSNDGQMPLKSIEPRLKELLGEK